MDSTWFSHKNQKNRDLSNEYWIWVWLELEMGYTPQIAMVNRTHDDKKNNEWTRVPLWIQRKPSYFCSDKSLVGGLEHDLLFHLLGIITPTDFHIFQRVETTNQIIRINLPHSILELIETHDSNSSLDIPFHPLMNHMCSWCLVNHCTRDSCCWSYWTTIHKSLEKTDKPLMNW